MVEKKNKVAVVTITNGPCNYGNMLQNYAVVKTIEKLKIEVETLYNIEDASYLVSKKHKIKNYLYKLIYMVLCRIVNLITNQYFLSV